MIYCMVFTVVENKIAIGDRESIFCGRDYSNAGEGICHVIRCTVPLLRKQQHTSYSFQCDYQYYGIHTHVASNTHTAATNSAMCVCACMENKIRSFLDYINKHISMGIRYCIPYTVAIVSFWGDDILFFCKKENLTWFFSSCCCFFCPLCFVRSLLSSIVYYYVFVFLFSFFFYKCLFIEEMFIAVNVLRYYEMDLFCIVQFCFVFFFMHWICLWAFFFNFYHLFRNRQFYYCNDFITLLKDDRYIHTIVCHLHM